MFQEHEACLILLNLSKTDFDIMFTTFSIDKIIANCPFCHVELLQKTVLFNLFSKHKNMMVIVIGNVLFSGRVTNFIFICHRLFEDNLLLIKSLVVLNKSLFSLEKITIAGALFSVYYSIFYLDVSPLFIILFCALSIPLINVICVSFIC